MTNHLYIHHRCPSHKQHEGPCLLNSNNFDFENVVIQKFSNLMTECNGKGHDK